MQCLNLLNGPNTARSEQSEHVIQWWDVPAVAAELFAGGGLEGKSWPLRSARPLEYID